MANLISYFVTYVYSWTNYKCISCYSNGKVANGYINENLGYEIIKNDNDMLSLSLEDNEMVDIQLWKENDVYQLKINANDRVSETVKNFSLKTIEPLIEYFIDYKNEAKTYNDISSLSVGMSPKDVHDVFGLANDSRGSGIIKDVYNFEDGRIIIIYYGATMDSLEKVYLLDSNGETETLIGG